MPATGTTYSNIAFANATALKNKILQVANTLGLRPEVIFGALVEENHDYLVGTTRNWLGDTWVSTSPLNHAQLLTAYNNAKAQGKLDDHNSWDKANVVLNDIGPFNIKIGTAIKLVQEYVAKTPAGQDPLNLRQYTNDYPKLVQDLMNSQAVPEIAGLMLDQARTYFISKVDPIYWVEGVSEMAEDALLITYYNFGPVVMEKNRIINMAKNGGEYLPQPGLGTGGGKNHIENAKPIGLIFGNLTYADGSLPMAYEDISPQISTIIPPPGLDTPIRNSAALISSTGAYTSQFNSGGGVDDLWVVERNAGRYHGTRDQFRADFVANNANVDPQSLTVQQGPNYFVPRRSANGDTTYHYSNGAKVMNNPTTGEYGMVIPNTDGPGGQTVYSRTLVGYTDIDGPVYEVKQISTNGANVETFNFSGQQTGLNGDIVPLQSTQSTDTGTHSEFYSPGGTPIGQVQALNGDAAAAQPATPSADLLSDNLQDMRLELGDKDEQVVQAAELRAIGGAQSTGEAWGGAHVMAAGESALGEYYRAILDFEAQNPTNAGTGSTAAPPALHLDYADASDGLGWEQDWGYDLGLGLLGGFGLGGGADVVNDVWQSQEGSYSASDWGYVGSTTSTGTTNAWSYDSYDYGSVSTDWGSTNWSYTDYSIPSYSNYNYTSSYNTYDSYDYGGGWGGGYDSYDYGSSWFGGWGGGYDSYDWDFWAPVALDLDADGIELVKQADSQAWYDVVGDGQRRHIGWLGKDDGFLAIDDNQDGQINLAKELSFALWTADTTDSDLQALATVFDTNHDNLFDALDDRFADFRVWQDANGDGVSDVGELKTLAQAGITSVALTVAQANWGSGGNRVSGFSSFTKTDGSKGWAADVALGYETQGWTAAPANASNAIPGLVQMTESGGRVYGLATGSTAVSVDLGSAGLDAVIGGGGNDVLLAGSRGAVMLEGGAGNDSLSGGAGDDWLDGGLGADSLNGGAGDDTLLIDAQDLVANIQGGEGFDVAMVMGSGGVTLNLATAGLEAAVGGEGNDTLTTSGTGRVVLAGGAGDDVLTGGLAGDVLMGDAGTDTLSGSAGNDVYVFNRGDGTDTVTDTHSISVDEGYVATSSYSYTETVTHTTTQVYTYPGGQTVVTTTSYIPVTRTVTSSWWQSVWVDRQVDAGTDTLRLGAGIGLEDISVSQVGADKLITLLANGVATGDVITLKNWTNTLSRVESIEFANGQIFDIDNLRWAASGINMVTGSTLADGLVGSLAADTLSGGAGNDGYVVNHAGDIVLENADEGTDMVRASISYALGANLENLTLTGAADINGAGNALANVLVGNGGKNMLDGDAGADSMVGGDGDDTYQVDNAGDVIFEAADEGTDTVNTSVTYTLAANLETLTLTGTAVIDGTGNDLNNALYGNDASNILSGGAGDDRLDGGAEADTLIGGIGNDTYVVDNAGDTVTEAGSEGTDTVVSALSYTLGNDVENLTLVGTDAISGTGNSLVNTLLGNSGANVLDAGVGADILRGNAGADMLRGGTGNDTYVFALGDGQDTIEENDSTLGNNDTISFAAGIAPASVAVSFNGADLVLSYGVSDVVTVKNWYASSAQKIEQVRFANGTNWNVAQITALANLAPTVVAPIANQSVNEDSLWSYVVPLDTFADADAVAGDILALGATRANGSALPAWLSFDAATRTLSGTPLNGDVGNLDLCITATDAKGATVSSSFTLAVANTNDAPVAMPIASQQAVETQAFSYTLPVGTFTDMDIGDAFTLSASLSDGSALPVWMSFDAATRTFSGTPPDTAAGTLIFKVTATDAAGAMANENFSLDIANIVMGTAAAETLLGTAGKDYIYGQTDNDTLDGGEGADTLIGGTGNDIYVVDNAGDTVVELAGEGTDAVQASVTHTLAANVENLTLTGTAVIDGTGNDLNNALIGNEASNVLSGGAGEDTLDGGAGDDVLVGGLNVDRYLFGHGYGQDTVSDTDTTAGNSDTVVMQAGILASDVVVSRTATHMVLTLGTSDDKVLIEWDVANGKRIERVEFADGTVWTANDLLVMSNRAPTYTTTPADKSTAEDALWSYTLPVDTFADLDGGDVLSYSASLADDSALPGWLSFNAATRTFSGTPGNANVGSLALKVKATDTLGAMATGTFNVMVANTNDAPTVLATLPGQQANETQAFSYVLPTGIFGDVDLGDSLTLSVILANGSALPSWLTFDPVTRTLSGTPPDTTAGILGLAVRATDAAGAFVQTGLSIDITNTINGTAGAETLTGTAGKDVLNGLAGNDTLNGGAGNDLVDGGEGSDALYGGAGDDTYFVDNAGDTVVETTSTTIYVDQGHYSTTYVDQGYYSTTYVDQGYWAYNESGGYSWVSNMVAQTSWVSNMVAQTTWVPNVVAQTTVSDTGGVDTINASVAFTLGANQENLTLTGSDAINGTGNALNNVLAGNSASNVLTGAAGEDTLDGGAGDDVLVGGLNNDRYIFGRGYGQDTVSDIDTTAGNSDTVVMQAGILASEVVVSRTATHMVLTLGTSDDKVLIEWDVASGKRVERVEFADGTVWTATDLLQMSNRAPTFTTAPGDQSTAEDALWSYTLPVDTFADLDGGDVLSYSASLADDSALPGWLSFNAAARTFSGTPGNANVGSLSLKVMVTDTFGAIASGVFNVMVTNTNDAPMVLASLPGQQANETQAFSYVLPVGTFGDVDVGDSLTLSATLANGSALPSWLVFNPATRTFAGTPPDTAAGILSLTVRATDIAGAFVQTGLSIDITNTINGTAAAETLTGTAGKDLLIGLAGNDTLNAGAGNDVLDGGTGADALYGGAGDDVYFVDNAGDTVIETTSTTTYVDQGYYSTTYVDQGYWAYNESGGYSWVSNMVAQTSWVPNVVAQTTVSDSGGADTVNASVTFALGTNQENLTLTGGDSINGTGNALSNTLTGNSASNVLTGGAGSDTYVLGRGANADRVQENDSTAGNTDVVKFLPSIATDQVWFRQVNNDLEASILGTADKFVIANWYLGAQYQVEQFKTTDGAKTLLASQVQNLVSAMAAFAPPAAGETTLTGSYATALAPVIAANWQ